MKKFFLMIQKVYGHTDMYVCDGFELDDEQSRALHFDTREEAQQFADSQMGDDDVVVVEEELI